MREVRLMVDADEHFVCKQYFSYAVENNGGKGFMLVAS